MAAGLEPPRRILSHSHWLMNREKVITSESLAQNIDIKCCMLQADQGCMTVSELTKKFVWILLITCKVFIEVVVKTCGLSAWGCAGECSEIRDMTCHIITPAHEQLPRHSQFTGANTPAFPVHLRIPSSPGQIPRHSQFTGANTPAFPVLISTQLPACA